MKDIVIGAGEIGKSLYNIFSKEYDVFTLDFKDDKYIVNGDVKINSLNDIEVGEINIMHVAFPYSDKFIELVEQYKAHFNPKYIVIHSTVPVGTSRKCNAISSPCTGIHPHLEESMLIFTKFLGGEKAGEVAQHFRRAGITVYLTDKSESTELMKIMCTTYYALCIEYTKEVKRKCDEFGIPFELWTIWTNNYNNGYKELGYPEYSRPNLIPMMNEQGGHCTIPNLKLLDSEFTKFIAEMNKAKHL
jgi:hypothetical protein